MLMQAKASARSIASIDTAISMGKRREVSSSLIRSCDLEGRGAGLGKHFKLETYER